MVWDALMNCTDADESNPAPPSVTDTGADIPERFGVTDVSNTDAAEAVRVYPAGDWMLSA
jgi:hypothetical protein